MITRLAGPNPFPPLIALALLGCAAGDAERDAGPSADGGAAQDSPVVSVTIARAEPYSEPLPAAEGVPARFEPEGRRVPIGECQPRLVDPQAGVRLRSAETRITSRSEQRGDTTFVTHRGYGDYNVYPPGSYGLGPDERLRVDCGRNVPVGRVGRGE